MARKLDSKGLFAMTNIEKISKKQILQGMNRTLKNSGNLLEEAKCLLARKAYSRSVVLAALSLEEIGKMIILAMCFHKDTSATSNKFSKKLLRLFSSHKAKTFFLEDNYGNIWKNVLDIHRRESTSRTKKSIRKKIKPLGKAHKEVNGYLKKMHLQSIAELKLKCLYVDYDKSTLELHLPYKVPSKVAKSLILIVERDIEEASELKDAFRKPTSSSLSKDILDLMSSDWEFEKLR